MLLKQALGQFSSRVRNEQVAKISMFVSLKQCLYLDNWVNG
jgi:hypothetical protein